MGKGIQYTHHEKIGVARPRLCCRCYGKTLGTIVWDNECDKNEECEGEMDEVGNTHVIEMLPR